MFSRASVKSLQATRASASSTVGCIAGTAALYFAGPGNFAIAIAALVVSNFFFGTGENLIAAFLPELAKGSALGKVSGWGWAFGYVGALQVHDVHVIGAHMGFHGGGKFGSIRLQH